MAELERRRHLDEHLRRHRPDLRDRCADEGRRSACSSPPPTPTDSRDCLDADGDGRESPPVNSQSPRIAGSALRSGPHPDRDRNLVRHRKRYTYQWQRSPDGVTWTAITGATGTTYTLAIADEGTEGPPADHRHQPRRDASGRQPPRARSELNPPKLDTSVQLSDSAGTGEKAHPDRPGHLVGTGQHLRPAVAALNRRGELDEHRRGDRHELHPRKDRRGQRGPACSSPRPTWTRRSAPRAPSSAGPAPRAAQQRPAGHLRHGSARPDAVRHPGRVVRPGEHLRPSVAALDRRANWTSNRRRDRAHLHPRACRHRRPPAPVSDRHQRRLAQREQPASTPARPFWPTRRKLDPPAITGTAAAGHPDRDHRRLVAGWRELRLPVAALGQQRHQLEPHRRRHHPDLHPARQPTSATPYG